MLREPYTVGSYVHVIKRGARGMPIVRDDADRRRFLLMLRHLNDEFKSDNWFRDLVDDNQVDSFNRPSGWPEQEKLVEILCYCLLDNHFHLILKEIKDGGISKFMQKLGLSFTKYFNEKYYEQGSIFQGTYKSKVINNDDYFRYVSVYVQVKNALEQYPGGLTKASRKFKKAYDWATKFPYSSLGESIGVNNAMILDKGLLGEVFEEKDEYRKFANDVIIGKYAEEYELLH